MDDQFTMLLGPYLKFIGAEDICAGTCLRDAGLDSMGAIELLFQLEDAYGFLMPDELLSDETFETAGSLWGAIARLHVSVRPEGL